MKHLVFLLAMCLGMSTTTFAQSKKKFAVCKVIEKAKKNGKVKVKVTFSKDVRYIGGREYEKNVLFDDKEILEFEDGQEAVSYLSDSWSWILCGNPTQLKKGKTMWTLRHEVDNNVSNYVRNMRTLEMSGQRYYTRHNDDMYFGYDVGDSH